MKKKELIAILTSFSLLTGISGCKKNGLLNTYTFNEIVGQNCDNTNFDEYINSRTLDNVEKLEKALYLSEKLHKLFKNESNNLNVDNEYLSSLDYVYNEMEYYKRNKDRINLDSKKKWLLVQEKLIDNYLLEDGYDIMETVSMALTKCKIYNAYFGLVDNNYKRISNVIIPSNNNLFDQYIKLELNNKKVVIKNNGDISTLIEYLYKMQSRGDRPDLKEMSGYNKYRNKLLKDTINQSKKVLSYNYKVNKVNVMKRLSK